MLARGKALSKKLTSYHRVPTPAFTVIPIGRKIMRPARLAFPLIVKSATEDASYGIAQASLVENEEKLKERVAFIHDKIGTDALVEQYIEGREIYVGVIGNERLRVLPVWELNFGDVTEDGKRIATARVKHDLDYQQRHNVTEGPAKGLAPEVVARIQRLAKRICRTLELDGYSRIDFRLTEDGTPYFIEANPNPEIARIEEFARAAAHDGIKYWALLERICALGIRRTRAVTEEAPIAP
jgi:D-alanine-D-alanine ligase